MEEVSQCGASYVVLITTFLRHIQSRRMRWSEHMAHLGQDRKVYKVLERKEARRKRPLGRSRHRCEDGMRMDLRKNDCGCGLWSIGSG
jgi:hypothetical protein